MTYLQALGAAIRAERKTRGWSQTRLVEESHVSRPLIMRLETGCAKHWPNLWNLRELACAFGMTPSALLDKAERVLAESQMEAAE